jgi:hypothetical protein
MLRAAPNRFFHAIPLHYVPYLLVTAVLLSQRRISTAGLPLRPRPTAAQRDRKLRLDGYVHLSFETKTPLLADKLARGYPHVLIEFGGEVACLPGAAFLRYNTKAWRHRDDFLPIGDPAGKTEFLREWCNGRFPSAELLVEGELPLHPLAIALRVVTTWEREWLEGLRNDLGLPTDLPIREAPEVFPPLAACNPQPFIEYASQCTAARQVLPPSDLPFD